jgi:hypothetical protein
MLASPAPRRQPIASGMAANASAATKASNVVMMFSFRMMRKSLR